MVKQENLGSLVCVFLQYPSVKMSGFSFPPIHGFEYVSHHAAAK